MEDQLYGKLFNSIPLHNQDHIDILLDSLNKDTSIHILIHAVKYAHESNIFTLGESEVLSKAIRILTKKEMGVEQSNPQE